MKLAKLCAAAGLACPDAEASVSGFAIDHRKVAPGTVFGAFRGAQVNGEDFIPAAIKAGAVAGDLEPEVAARAIIGMIVQVLDWWTRDTGRMPAQKVVDTITRFRLCGMKTP